MSGVINENIKVFIRQRPQIGNQYQTLGKIDAKQSGIQLIAKDETKCSYFSSVNNSIQEFCADKFFTETAQQSDLYDRIARPLVDSALFGYSGTIFAYGPTNSGKTFTMRGGNEGLRGIMPRCIEHLLNERECINSAHAANRSHDKITIWASYVQIYCETVTDLLVNNNSSCQLHIREKSGSVYVEGLSRFQITSIEEFWELLARGDENRNTAATNMNEMSSRSHAALVINVVIREDSEQKSDAADTTAVETYKESTLMLVDLAGSERASASVGRDYMRAEEAKSINLSLSALGNCMNALAEGRLHIPYRDSKLTRLLQGCLGGDARTAVIVNVPPGEDYTGETLNALRFASRASKVKVAAKIKRCEDFEALYLATKKTLDALEKSGGTTGQKRVANTEQQLRQKDEIIEQQRSEIESLKLQLLTLEKSAQLVSTATVPAVTSITHTESPAALTNEWNQKLATLAEQHVNELNKLNRSYQLRCDQHRNVEQQLSSEISTLQDEISTDRSALLTAMQDLRALHERKTRGEASLQARVEELLEELADKRGGMETLQESNRSLQQRLDESVTVNQTLQDSVSQMVSREQVKEMEGLFIDTVAKLSARVNFLESNQQKGGQLQSQSQLQFQNQQHFQASNNNNSCIKIEPGGKIRAVSLTGGSVNNVVNDGGEVNRATGGSRQQTKIPHSSSNSNILSTAGTNSRSSNNGIAESSSGKNKLW